MDDIDDFGLLVAVVLKPFAEEAGGRQLIDGLFPFRAVVGKFGGGAAAADIAAGIAIERHLDEAEEHRHQGILLIGSAGAAVKRGGIDFLGAAADGIGQVMVGTEFERAACPEVFQRDLEQGQVGAFGGGIGDQLVKQLRLKFLPAAVGMLERAEDGRAQFILVHHPQVNALFRLIVEVLVRK